MRLATDLAWRLVHLVVAVALGAGAVVWAVDRVDDTEDPRPELAAGDRVAEAIEGVRADRVHVTDDAREMLSEEGEQDLQALIAERDLPVYVVVWRSSREAGYHLVSDAARTIAEALPEPALLVLWEDSDYSTVETSEGYRLGRDEETSTSVEGPSFLGDVATTLTEWLRALPPDPLEPWERSDYYGGPVGGFFVGLLYATPVLLGLWIVMGLARVSTGRRFLNRPFEQRPAARARKPGTKKPGTTDRAAQRTTKGGGRSRR